MGSVPRFKVHRRDGEYIAACKFPADAAVLTAQYGPGSVIRDRDGMIVWREGQDEQTAAHEIEEVVYRRIARGNSK